jgi:hypothetical protein
MRYAILTFIFALLTTQVRADERFLPYIEWLVENSPYEYNGEELPTIVQMPYAWLEVEVYGPEQVAQSEARGQELPKISGAYNPETNEMLFADDVDPWAWEHRDTIVHELVHFLQQVNDAMDECSANNEREAYELHWQWVEEHGHEADFEEPSWIFVFMLSMYCNDMHQYR